VTEGQAHLETVVLGDELGKDLGCLNLHWALALLKGMCTAGLSHLVFSPGARSTPLLIAAQRLEAAGCLQLTPILDERSAAFFALGLARARLRPVALLATSGSAPAHWYPAVIEAAEVGLPLLLLSADRPPRLHGWGANQTIDQTRLFGRFVRDCFDPGLPQATAAALKAQFALGRRAALVSSGKHAGPVHLNLPFDEPLVPGPDCRAVQALEYSTAQWQPQSEQEQEQEPQPQQLAQSASASIEPGMGDYRAHEPTTPAAEGGAANLRPVPRDLALNVRLSGWPLGRGLILCGPGAEPRTPVSATKGRRLASSLWRCAGALALPVLVDPLSGLRTGGLDHQAMAQGAGNAISVPRISGYDAFLRHPTLAAELRPDWVLRIGRAPVSKVLGRWLEGLPSILVGEAGTWSDPDHDALIQLEFPAAAVCDALLAQRLVAPRPDWLARWYAAEQWTWSLAQDSLAPAAPLSPATATARAPAEGAPERLPWRWGEAQVISAVRAAIPDNEALLCANSMPIRQLDTWWRGGGPAVVLLGNRGVSGIDGYLSTLAGINQAGLPCWGLVGDLSLCHDLSGLLLASRLERPLLVLNNGGGHIFDYLPQSGLADFRRLWQTPQSIEMAALAGLGGLRHWQVADTAGLDRALAEAGQGPGLIECLIDPEVSRRAHLDFVDQIRGSPVPSPD